MTTPPTSKTTGSNTEQPWYTPKNLATHALNGTFRITAFLPCTKALSMVGEIALRGLDTSVRMLGSDTQENVVVKWISHNVLSDSPIRQYAQIPTRVLAQNAVIFAVVGLILNEVALRACDKPPKIWDLVTYVSPFKLSEKKTSERLNEAKEYVRTGVNAFFKKDEKAAPKKTDDAKQETPAGRIVGFLTDAGSVIAPTILGAMVGVTALEMHGEGITRVLDKVIRTVGINPANIPYLGTWSGQLLGMPFRSLSAVPHVALAKTAVVLSTASYALMLLGRVSRGDKTPELYGIVTGTFSPFTFNDNVDNIGAKIQTNLNDALKAVGIR